MSADGTTQVKIKAHGSKLSIGATAGSLASLVGSGTWSADVFGTGATSTVGYTVGNATGTPTLSIDSVTGFAGTAATPVTKSGKDGSSVSGMVTYTKDGYTKILTIRVSVSATGAKKASIKITLTGRDVQKTTGTLAALAGTHTWSGTTCDGTAVGITYTVDSPAGTVTYVSASGGTVTLGKSEHGWARGAEKGSSSTPASGFVAHFDGTRLVVRVGLVKMPDGTYKLDVGYNKGCRSKTPVTPPTVNTKILPGASNQPADHNGDQRVVVARTARAATRAATRRLRLRRQLRQPRLTSLASGRAREGWPRLGGAILLLLAVAACSPTPSTATGPSSPGSAAAPSAASGTASAASAADASAALDAALAPLKGSSAFSTTITVDGASAVTMTGRSAGPASTATVTTGAKTVDYVTIPPKAWARSAGGTWVLVSADTAPTGPVAALSAPTSVTGDGSGPGTVLHATYPASAFGLTGDPVKVTVTLGAGNATFTYSVTSSGHTTEATTVLQPAAAAPIAAPAP